MCPWHARMCVEVMCLYIFPHEAIYCCFVLLTDWKVAKFRFVKEQSALVNALSICMPHPPGFCFGEASGRAWCGTPFCLIGIGFRGVGAADLRLVCGTAKLF